MSVEGRQSQKQFQTGTSFNKLQPGRSRRTTTRSHRQVILPPPSQTTTETILEISLEGKVADEAGACDATILQQ